MKTAIVTGASSGIGYAISKVLIDLDYKVYGLGRNFSKCHIESTYFIKVELDLTRTSELENEIKKIREQEDVYILINNAGVGYFGLHEELNRSKIHELVTVNLEVPLLLSQLLMRDLKKNNGYIINISSVTAKMSSPHGAAYGATKSALTHFSNSLFDESRKYGVRVIAIHPDMTDTNFYRNVDFKTSDNINAHISPSEVAEAVRMVLTQRDGIVMTDITIRPQINMIKR